MHHSCEGMMRTAFTGDARVMKWQLSHDCPDEPRQGWATDLSVMTAEMEIATRRRMICWGWGIGTAWTACVDARKYGKGQCRTYCQGIRDPASLIYATGCCSALSFSPCACDENVKVLRLGAARAAARRVATHLQGGLAFSIITTAAFSSPTFTTSSAICRT